MAFKDKEAQRAYYLKHKDQMKASALARYNDKKEECQACTAKYRAKNKDKSAAYARAYKADPSKLPRIQELSREATQRGTRTLADRYIRARLKEQGFPKEAITPELIELKRIIIKTTRLCRQLKNS